MQRFFFHMRANGCFVRDAEGRMLANTDLLYAEALACAHRMRGTNLAGADGWEGCQVEVVDESGHVLDVVPFEAAPHHH